MSGAGYIAIDLDDEAATARLAQRLAAALAPGDLVVLEGDLGAGKTTFVRYAARALGVPEAIAVTSPTFALVHELPGERRVVHADLYRLESAGEVAELGLDEQRAEGAILFVEWGERFLHELGAPEALVRLSLEGGDRRRARVEVAPGRGDRIRAALSTGDAA